MLHIFGFGSKKTLNPKPEKHAKVHITSASIFKHLLGGSSGFRV